MKKKKDRPVITIDPFFVKYSKKHAHMKPIPRTEEEQNNVGIEFIVWTKKPENLEIEDFCIEKGFVPFRFYRLADRNEFFADCLAMGKYILGQKIKHGVRTGNIEFAYLKEVFPQYNPEYRQFVYDRIAKNIEQIKTTFVTKEVSVEIEQVPSSPLVPLIENQES